MAHPPRQGREEVVRTKERRHSAADALAKDSPYPTKKKSSLTRQSGGSFFLSAFLYHKYFLEPHAHIKREAVIREALWADHRLLIGKSQVHIL